MIDALDIQILTILQSDARTSNVDVARAVGLAPSAVLERIRKLEERGLIKGYRAQLDAHALGFGLMAFVYVRTEDRHGETADLLAKLPEAQEVHHVAGEDCYLVKVRVTDAEALGSLLRERIGAIKTVRSTRTTVVLQTVKEAMALPIGEASAGDKRTVKGRSRKRKQGGRT
ncbi:MAG: Lrp/AsnC family transcriptional regulator [Pyrinomonadaceae bacterium]|nr:Lrp/AsnC family transcriptional regulator [Pyrinomonadaceae bacterium]